MTHTPPTAQQLDTAREHEIRTLDLTPLMDDRSAAVISGHLAVLLAEVDRLRAERDEFCNRVDTLTAVAKGNKRHVQELFLDLQKAQATIARLRARRLTPGEYDAAWHAVEGAAGEEGADPGTVLHTVLDRLGIDWQDAARPAAAVAAVAETGQ